MTSHLRRYIDLYRANPRTAQRRFEASTTEPLLPVYVRMLEELIAERCDTGCPNCGTSGWDDNEGDECTVCEGTGESEG